MVGWRDTLGGLLRSFGESPRLAPDREGHARSLRLLVNNLSPVQRQQLARHNYFDVIGGDTGTRYRIHDGRTLNIAQLNESGGCERLLCFEPEGALPVGDVRLAQKVALELFEAEAIKAANASPAWVIGPEHRRANSYVWRHR
jgi:hypothetical protein